MRRDTVEATARWRDALHPGGSVTIVFHGGEPLVAGAAFYGMALPLLRDRLAPRNVRFGVQSNLWLLTNELAGLFREYDVSVATSLDGPEAINDPQRGEGSFRRTMAGIQLARAHNLRVACICTVTSQSVQHTGEIVAFFVSEGLDFDIHAAVPAFDAPDSAWCLSPSAYGQCLVDVLDQYLADSASVRIGTLDAVCRSLSSGRGGVCTFVDCLGNYLAVDPEGWIYPCQRFAGIPDYRLGHVDSCPSQETLTETTAWHMLRERQKAVDEACADCPYLDLCRGGCPYNALAVGGPAFERSLRDPYCPAYRRLFAHVTDRALEEVFSEENLNAVVERGSGQRGMMQEGTLLRLMRGGPRPSRQGHRADIEND